jgi:leucyl-tRNA synthetase
MISGIKRLGISIAWERQIRTDDPDYYKWTQFILTNLFRLSPEYLKVQLKEMSVHFCSKCKKVLTYAEVKAGKCDACGSKPLTEFRNQWIMTLGESLKNKIKTQVKEWEISKNEKHSVHRWLDEFQWIISREWSYSPPFPILKCPNCGFTPVGENDLPVLIGGEDKQLICPKCGSVAYASSYTITNWLSSSWFWIRLLTFGNENAFDKNSLSYWKNVDISVGSIAHITRHLLYSSIVSEVLCYLGYLPSNVPYSTRVNLGRIQNSNSEVITMANGSGRIDEVIERAGGADILRWALLSIATTRNDVVWNDDLLFSARKKIKRLLKVFTLEERDICDGRITDTIRKINEYYEQNRVYMVISAVNDLVNTCLNMNCASLMTKTAIYDAVDPIIPHLACAIRTYEE